MPSATAGEGEGLVMNAKELDELLKTARDHGEAVLYSPSVRGLGHAFELVKQAPEVDTRMGCVERNVKPRRAAT